MDNYRDAADTVKLDRLIRLIRERAGHWLAIQMEAAKIALSGTDRTDVDLHRIERELMLPITRDEFDESIGKLVVKTEQTVKDMLASAGVDAASVDTILFTGGSSSVPLLRQRLGELLPQARRVEGDLFGGIGSGLALDAARKLGEGVPYGLLECAECTQSPSPSTEMEWQEVSRESLRE